MTPAAFWLIVSIVCAIGTGFCFWMRGNVVDDRLKAIEIRLTQLENK